MLSDEEKEAIERIDYIQDFIIENGQYNADVNDMEYFSKILNLIEKQSKEIEELKEEDDANLAYYDQIYQKGIYTGQKAVEDKIKAKIKEYLEYDKKYKRYLKDGRECFTMEYYYAKMLQSLLEKSRYMDKIIKTDNGVNIKILTKDLCCIYGENENSSNYFVGREYLVEALKIFARED